METSAPTWRTRASSIANGFDASLAAFIVIATVAIATRPLFDNLDKWGGQDWDSITFFRYYAVKSLKTYHQFPFWDPYACGGHDAWGYIESDSNVVSPWLPLYLLLDLRWALRLEIVGTVVVAAVGVWLLTSRFTRCSSARAFACIVWVVNGRWALQTTAGHSWHLYYAWLPWVLYFYDRSHGVANQPWAKGWWKNAWLAGAFAALMVYDDGLYPLPHTAFMLAVYGGCLAFMRRTVQPIAAGSVAAVTAIALSAPRLFAIADEMSRAPRRVESNETMDLGTFIDLLTHTDGAGRHGGPPLQWGWHEWGSYIGWASIAVLLLGFWARGPRERSLKVLTLALVALAFGNFHEYAPWHILHKFPVFSSLHVPSRWLYPAILTAAIVAAVAVGRAIARTGRWRGVVELVSLLAVAWIGKDIGNVSRKMLTGAFWMELPATILPQSKEFHQEYEVPTSLRYVASDWNVPSLPAAIANVGVVQCYAVGTINGWAVDANGHHPVIGAVGKGQPQYRGEVFVESGRGTAEVEKWSPNTVDVRVTGAQPGDVVILNANYNAGWNANGSKAFAAVDRVATHITSTNQRIRFQYVPRTLVWGLAVFLMAFAPFVISARTAASRRKGLLPTHTEDEPLGYAS